MCVCVGVRLHKMQITFANGLGDQDSIPGQVMPKTQKMVLDATLLSTQHYMVRIKGKMEQRPPLHLSVVAIEKGGLQVTPLQRSPTLLNKTTWKYLEIQ